jgi:hypothetical protein
MTFASLIWVASTKAERDRHQEALEAVMGLQVGEVHLGTFTDPA